MENLKLLSKVALSFQRIQNFDKDMNDILEEIGRFIDVSRIYIFLNETKDIINNTFEWCNKEITPQIQNLQKVKCTHVKGFQDIMSQKGYISLSDIREMPQEIIDLLKPQQVKSLVAYPLIINNKIWGFIGFDECKYKRIWKPEELEILGTLSAIIANAYERKFFHEEIIESETNFRNFFETIDDMFMISDLNGNILHCNSSAINKLGYSYSEFKKMNLLELHPQETREEAAILLQEMLNKERIFCPIPFIGKNGEIYEVESKVLIGKWDKEDCIYAISKDLTKENEKFQIFSSIFKNNPLPMSINDATKKSFIKINPAFLKNTGYNEEDICGKTIDEVDLFTDPEKMKAFIKKRSKGEKVRNEEISIKRKDGNYLKVLFSIEDITIQGKKSFLTVMVDITEREELAKSVEDKFQKLTNVIDGTNLGTWEWDILTGQMKVNEHFAKMIGYLLKELEITDIDSLSKFINPEDLESARKIMKMHLDGETEYYDFEMRMKHKDGSWIWIHDRGRVTQRNKNGEPIRMFGTYLDISLRKKMDKSLKESEERFMIALNQTKAGLWDMDMISGDVYLSPMWKEILGYKDDEIKDSSKVLESLSHIDDVGRLKKARDDYFEGRTDHYEIVHRLRHKDGNWRWILTRGGIFKDERGTPKRWIGTNIDITAEYEQSLELERFFSINLDLLCIIDTEGIFIKSNKAWEELLGCSSEQMKGQRFDKFIHPDDIKDTLEIEGKLKNEGRITSFINRYLCADGKYHYIEWKARLYEDVIYAAARDITTRIIYEKKILEISNRDSLTNVYNRRYVYNRAEEIIEEYKRTGNEFSICIIDIDKFKMINDSHGHQIGDCVLIEFTKVIQENLRIYDILGRYGGEEFIVILKNSDIKNSSLIIERILNIVTNTTFTFDDININFTFSAGISDCNEVEKEKMTIDNLVKIADGRMYKSKNSNRNIIVTND